MHSEEEKTEPDLSAIIEDLIEADVNFILVGGLMVNFYSTQGGCGHEDDT